VSVSFKTLDLNLLKVFDAVMEERSVLRASQKVALSQSAVSHSLARLREMLDDELFVRTATGMQPTARALTMAPQVRQALRSLEAAVELPTFAPAVSTKPFTLAANDFTTMVLAPPLLKILSREAPAIDLTIKPVTRIDLAEQIDLGRIDVAIGVFSSPPSRFRTALLFEYDDVLIVGKKRKLGRLDNAKLATLPLVVVSFGGEQKARSAASSPSAGSPDAQKCMIAPRLNGRCPTATGRPGSRSRCRISWPCRHCWSIPSWRLSFRGRWRGPSSKRMRSRPMNCPTARYPWRYGCCGTSGSRRSHRTNGFTRCSAAQPKS
jgi:DNA-binding transcriptional LysR family regulator